jgi:hypothetical protein
MRNGAGSPAATRPATAIETAKAAIPARASRRGTDAALTAGSALWAASTMLTAPDDGGSVLNQIAEHRVKLIG